MSSSFDPYDWASFYFGKMGREEAARLLESNDDIKVRHYLIEQKELEDGGTNVKIAEQYFTDIPMLLNHFKMRILDKTSLTTPYRKGQIERVIGLFRFEGERETDLPFEAGEELEIIGKPESEWWQARNALNSTGLIPANYVISVDENGDRQSKGHSQSSFGSSGGDERFSGVSSISETNEDRYEPSFPAWARVVFDRQPNAYDPTQLKLKKGQVVRVTKKLTNGMYEGEMEGRTGIIPFTYIRFMKPEASE
uniref:SH3 domain-containing protein n=1 Tax=Heterorhabditis bacteriophora TaxID=37862 RepID=A0A1I7X7V3_HETBA